MESSLTDRQAAFFWTSARAPEGCGCPAIGFWASRWKEAMTHWTNRWFTCNMFFFLRDFPYIVMLLLNSQRVAIHFRFACLRKHSWIEYLADCTKCIVPGKMQRVRISLGSSGSGHGNFVLWAVNQVGWRLKTLLLPFCRCCQGGFNESRGIEAPWGSVQILSPIEIGDLPGMGLTPGGRRASPSSPTKGDARVSFFLRRSQNSENGNLRFTIWLWLT